MCVFSNHRVLIFGSHIKNQKFSYNHPVITLFLKTKNDMELDTGFYFGTHLHLFETYKHLSLKHGFGPTQRFVVFLTYTLSYQYSRNTVKREFMKLLNIYRAKSSQDRLPFYWWLYRFQYFLLKVLKISHPSWMHYLELISSLGIMRNYWDKVFQ